MFINQTRLLLDNPMQLNYGIAVTDFDGDGAFELVVAGFTNAPNLILKWNGSGFVNVAPPILADPERQAIGVAAADIDGDGEEEIYILNTDTFAGHKRLPDRLFDRVGDEWTDLFSLHMSQPVINLTAGRSVASVDRTGDGLYGFFVANYGGPMRLYELDEDGRLQDVAPEARLALVTGARSVLAMPLVTDRMDIFVGNEGGANYLFRNNGDGTFREIGRLVGVGDAQQNARGVSTLDVNGDGRFDLVVCNWEGPHRLFQQGSSGAWYDVASEEMSMPSRVRNVIVADFDNDGYEEIFYNNIGESNRLFGCHNDDWVSLDPGDALEPHGLGTGAAIGDFDRDGRLELIIAHGETGLQPLTLYHTQENGMHFARILPLTRYGAPARGALVTLTAGGRTQRRVIDAGSGYLCQMEPVAHFGLGRDRWIDRVEVRWPDGATRTISAPPVDTQIRVEYPTS